MQPYDAIASVIVLDVLLAAIVGAVIAAVALVLTRLPKLSATSRHVVWTLAIVAIGLAPFVAVGRSFATRHVVVHTAYAFPATGVATAPLPGPPSSDWHGAPSAVIPPQLHPAESDTTASDGSVLAKLPTWLPAALLAAWIVGAIVGVGFLVASLIRVGGLKRRSSPLSEAMSHELPWLTAVTGREILLRLSYEIETPVAVGFRRPVVLIPSEFTDDNGLADIEALVQHEHAHLRRYDDWTNLVQRVVERIFWWNPIVLIVGRRIALEREIAADDCVVASGEAPQRYAQSLWKLAREMRMPEHASVAPGAMFTRKQISIRIECLLDAGRNALPRLSPGVAWAAFAFGLVGVGTVAGIAPALEIDRTETIALHSAADRAAPEATPSPRVVYVKTSVAPGSGERRTVVASSSHHGRHGHHEHTDTHGATVAYVSSDGATPVAPSVKPPPSAPPSGLTTEQQAAIERSSKQLAGRVLAQVATGLSSERAAAALRAEAARDGVGQASSIPSIPPIPSSAVGGRSSLAELYRGCRGCDLEGKNLRGADLHGLVLEGANMANADLRGANLRGARLTGVILESAQLDGADLRDAVIAGSNLQHASLKNVRTEGLRLMGTAIDDADFRGTSVRPFVEACTGCDFANFDFRGQDLHGLHFRGADLDNANFAGANLRGASFAGSNIENANFHDADLTDVDLSGANYDNAAFRNAKITGIRWSGRNPPDPQH
jgi:uncharacterized protein YjbI with pentapeptide repeats/beta-lactamase regulating signal transducer with metallopeptidase domain